MSFRRRNSFTQSLFAALFLLCCSFAWGADPSLHHGLSKGIASPFPSPAPIQLSNGMNLDSSGNLMINAGMGGGGTSLSNGLSLDSSGNLLVNCAVGCSGGGGSGTVNPATAQQLTFYSSTGAAVSGDANLTDTGSLLNYTGAFNAAQVGFGPGTASAPSSYFTAVPAVGFYLALNSAVWTVTTTSGTGTVVTLTLTNTHGWTFPGGFVVNAAVDVSGVGTGYDCTQCIITAVSGSGSGGTISYANTGTATFTSGSVQLYIAAMSTAMHNFQFNALRSSSANPSQNGSIQLGPSDTITIYDVANNYQQQSLGKNLNSSLGDTRATLFGDPTYGYVTGLNAPAELNGPVDLIGVASTSSAPSSKCRMQFNSTTGQTVFTNASGGSCGPSGNFSATVTSPQNSQSLCYSTSLSAWINCYQGIPVDATNPATLLSSDRANYLNWTSGSALALPAITGGIASNFPYVLQNTSGGTLTTTPTSPNLIDGSATGTLLNDWSQFVYSDTAGPNWFSIKVPTFAAFGSTCTNGLNWSTTSGLSCAASPPLTTITGDVTLSGSTATVGKLENVPFCTGFTPTNGQAIEYTTGSSPNPCYTAVTPSGGGGLSGMTATQIPIAATATTVTSSVPAPTGTIVGTTDSQTLTNKSIAASEINSGAVATANGGTGQTTTVWADPRNSTSPAPSAGGDWCAGVNSLWSSTVHNIDGSNPIGWTSSSVLYCNSNPLANAPSGAVLKLPCSTIVISVTWASGGAPTDIQPCMGNNANGASYAGTVIQLCSDSTGTTGCGPNAYPSFELTATNEYPVGEPNAPALVCYSSGATWGSHFCTTGSTVSTGTATFAASTSVTGSGVTWTSAMVGGYVVDCDSTLSPACSSIGHIIAVPNSTTLTLDITWAGSANSGHAYTIWQPNVFAAYCDGCKPGGLSATVFAHIFGPAHFDLGGIANATAYLNPAICQERCFIDAVAVTHNGGNQAHEETNQAYACGVWDRSFRLGGGSAHWGISRPSQCSVGTNGGGTSSNGWMIEMYSILNQLTGGGPEVFKVGTVTGASGHLIQVPLSIDGVQGANTIDCPHMEYINGDGVSIGVTNAVSGVKVEGCTIANTFNGDVVHFLTPTNGTSISNIVENVTSGSGNKSLIVDDSNTGTNVTSATNAAYWQQTGSKAYFSQMTATGLDMHAATSATALQLPKIASPSPGTTPAPSYDTTQAATITGDANWGTVSVPVVVSTCEYDGTVPSAHCYGSSMVTAGTATTNCIATTNATSNCTVGASTFTYYGWQLEIPANTLVAAKKIRVDVGYQQAVAATEPTFTFASFLCTISACASGTVTTMTTVAVVPTANFSGAMASFEYTGTAAAGATANVYGNAGYTSASSATIGLPSDGNTTTQPVANATNGNLFLNFGLKFSSLATAGNYIRFQTVTVTVYN